MNPPAETREKSRWSYAVLACGAFAIAFSGWALFHLLFSLRDSSDGDANGMLRFFLCINTALFLASFRLLFRRRWAGVTVALFGWFWIYDLTSSPVGFGQIDWLTCVAIVATLTLTVALFRGEKVWEQGI